MSKARPSASSEPLDSLMRDDEYQAMYNLERTLWWYRGMRQITRAIIGDNLAPNPGLCFLDAGCGTGYSLTWLKEELKTEAGFGVDLSRVAASFWNRTGVRTAAVSSICDLPYLSNSFDLVTCFDVIYQLDHDQAGAAVSELDRVLKPGGLIYIREPAYDWLRGSHDKAVGTRHRYTLGELKGLVGSYGLIPRRATYANTFLFLPAVAHRLISRLSGDSDSDVKPVAGWLDSGLRSILRVEASMLRRFNAFFGLSAIVLAQKTAASRSARL